MKADWKKSFMVPIYNVKVTLIVTDHLVDRILKLDKTETREGNKETKGYTYMDWPYVHSLFDSNSMTHNSISHEIDHITHFIMRSIGIQETEHSDEAYAYMNGYLTEKVMGLLQADYKLT